MKKNRICALVVMIIGLLVLTGGLVCLILRLNAKPEVADGDYLVSVGTWALALDDVCNATTESGIQKESENEAGDNKTESEEKATGETQNDTNCSKGSGVEWQFKEIGKGTLTTNHHLNDYDFAWAIKENHLIIQTEWMYQLDNDYVYTLDQGNGVLVLSDGENEYRFVAQSQ